MTYRLLVVEDDPDLSSLLVGLLADAGYRVLTATDGLEALEQVVAGPPDLIVSDVRMPRMTGLELCALLKESPQTRLVPFMFLTCVDDPVTAFDVGADDFLAKPFRPRELLARVRALLRRAQAPPPGLAQGLRGDLSELSLIDVLQALQLARSCGCLTIVTGQGASRAKLWLEQGELVAGLLEGEQRALGEEALLAACEWGEGLFAFDSTQRAEHWTVQMPLQSLLLEATRRLDAREGGLCAASKPSEGTAASAARTCALPDGHVSLEELAQRIDEIRNRLKLKAFEAVIEGRVLCLPGDALPRQPHPGVTLPAELDELIEQMLSREPG